MNGPSSDVLFGGLKFKASFACHAKAYPAFFNVKPVNRLLIAFYGCHNG